MFMHAESMQSREIDMHRDKNLRQEMLSNGQVG